MQFYVQKSYICENNTQVCNLTICYEELLELHVYFIVTNYDVIHIIMISMHDVRFTHS